MVADNRPAACRLIYPMIPILSTPLSEGDRQAAGCCETRCTWSPSGGGGGEGIETPLRPSRPKTVSLLVRMRREREGINDIVINRPAILRGKGALTNRCEGKTLSPLISNVNQRFLLGTCAG